MNEIKLFADEKISTLFLKIAIPGSIGMLFSGVYAILDALFVSNYLGGTAFSALNLALPFVMILTYISDLIGVGSSVLISIALGKGHTEQANKLFSVSALLIVLLEAALSIVFFLACPLVFRELGAQGDMLDMATSYMRMYLVFLPVSALCFAFDNYLRISGKVKTSMGVNIFMCVFIIAMEYLFLGVFHMGVWASALASSISFVVCSLFDIFLFAGKKLTLQFVKPSVPFRDVLDILKNGSATFINNVSGKIMGIIFNAILLRIAGQNGVNTLGILLSIESFIVLLMYGCCDALQPAIGYNLGRGKIDRVKAIQKLVYAVSGTICLAAAVLLLALPERFAEAFLDASQSTALGMTVTAIFIYAFTWLTRWFSYATQSYFAALNKPFASAVLSMAISLVVPCALLWLATPLGATGVWLNYPLTSLIVCLMAVVMLLYKIKRNTLYKI